MSSSLIESPGTIRPMLWLTAPVLVEQILHLLVGFVDLWLTGNFLPGAAYVAAMTLVVYALWMIGNLFGFISHGATALTARFVGASDRPLANRVMNQAILSGAIWTGVLMLALLPSVSSLVGLMGLSGEAAEAATRYLTIELCVLPAIMIERVGIACLRGAGDMVTGLVTMGIVNLINMVASYSLVVGLGPLPELGWTGIALGTAIGHMAGASIILTLLITGRAGYHLRWELLRPDFDLIRRLLRVGIPAGADMILLNLCHMAYLRVVLQLGDVSAAAHGVAIQVEALGYMPGAAFQISAATLAGQYLGAGDLHRARRSVIASCAVAGVVMMAAGLLFYIMASPLASFFLGGEDSDVVPLAASLLHIVAFVMLPLAIAMVLAGALRGAGDTRWPLLCNMGGMVLLRIPLAIYLSHSVYELPFGGGEVAGVGLGIVGAWYAAVADISIRSLLLMLRFFHGGWQRVEV